MATLLQKDPSLTTHQRLGFVREMRARFKALKDAIRKLVVDDDAFGLAEPKNQIDKYLVLNQIFSFATDAEKVKGFREWLKQQVDDGILGLQAGADPQRPWTSTYVESAYKQGVIRSYLQVRGDLNDLNSAIGQISQSEFLSQAFNGPVGVKQLQLLQTRAFEQLKGISQSMSADISRVLSDGLARGDNPKEIARELVRSVEGIERRRADVLARTEIVHAQAEGQLDSLEALGISEVGAIVEWSADLSSACPLCSSLNGIVLSIKEARGLIPRHPRCKCAWIPAPFAEKGQKRGKKKVDAAIAKSIKLEKPKAKGLAQAKKQSRWAGSKVKIKDRRSKSFRKGAQRPTRKSKKSKALGSRKNKPQVLPISAPELSTRIVRELTSQSTTSELLKKIEVPATSRSMVLKRLHAMADEGLIVRHGTKGNYTWGPAARTAEIQKVEIIKKVEEKIKTTTQKTEKLDKIKTKTGKVDTVSEKLVSNLNRSGMSTKEIMQQAGIPETSRAMTLKKLHKLADEGKIARTQQGKSFTWGPAGADTGAGTTGVGQAVQTVDKLSDAQKKADADAAFKKAIAEREKKNLEAAAKAREALKNQPTLAGIRESKQAQADLIAYIDKYAVKEKHHHSTMSKSEDVITVYIDNVKYLFPEHMKQKVVEDVIDLAKSDMPPVLLQANRSVAYTTQRNKDDSYWEKKYNMKNFRSHATGGRGQITVYSGDKLGVSSYAHESGHNLAYNRWGNTEPPSTSKYGQAQKVERPVSKYGSKSASEDFAEAAKQYTMDRARFAREFPKKHEAFAELMGDKDKLAKEAAAKKAAEEAAAKKIAEEKAAAAKKLAEEQAAKAKAERERLARIAAEKLEAEKKAAAEAAKKAAEKLAAEKAAREAVEAALKRQKEILDEIWAKREAAEAALKRQEVFGASKATVIKRDKMARGLENVVDDAIKVLFEGKPVTYQDIASMVGAPDDAKVSIGANNNKNILIDFEGPGYSASRILKQDDKGNLQVYNAYIDVKDKGKGTGTKIFGRQVEQAAKFNIKSISAEAYGNPKADKEEEEAHFNGYYTWPRLGYDGPLRLDRFGFIDAEAYEVRKVPQEFYGAKNVSDLMKTEAGRKWWKENGKSTPMEFDLTPGSRSMEVFDAYLKEKGIK